MIPPFPEILDCIDTLQSFYKNPFAEEFFSCFRIDTANRLFPDNKYYEDIVTERENSFKKKIESFENESIKAPDTYSEIMTTNYFDALRVYRDQQLTITQDGIKSDFESWHLKNPGLYEITRFNEYLEFLNKVNQYFLETADHHLKQYEDWKYRKSILTFKDMFIPTDWKFYIDALHKVENPVIDKEYNYIGGRNGKGVICSWIKDLQTDSIIKKTYNRQQLAAVLNNEIKGINLGNDGKTIDNTSNTYDKKVSGSLPYFVDGQNFSNDINKLKEGIQLISDTIDTNLFEAEVNLFETGITIEIPNKPIEIFNSHYKIPGMETKILTRGKLYEDTIRQIKLYDAGHRLKKMLSIADRQRLAAEKGYNPEGYNIRFESKYKKPAIHFKQRIILIEDLFKSHFINNCKMDLLSTYEIIKKEGIFTPPQTKKDCTLPAIELLVLKELAMIYGFNAEECLKNKINSIPDSIINKVDKKNRKRSLAGLSKKIKKNEVNFYDLSNVLRDRLKIVECFI